MNNLFDFFSDEEILNAFIDSRLKFYMDDIKYKNEYGDIFTKLEIKNENNPTNN